MKIVPPFRNCRAMYSPVPVYSLKTVSWRDVVWFVFIVSTGVKEL